MVKNQISKLGIKKTAGKYDLTREVNIAEGFMEMGQPRTGCTEKECGESPSKGTLDVSDAIDMLGFGKFQIMLSLFTGVCWMADSMEMKTLSILPPALHFFLGMMLSAPIWGYFGDRYGRQKTLWISVGVLGAFGATSSISPSYYWLLAFRFVVGIGIGCVPQSVTLYSEFLPRQQRAKCLVLIKLFWALGHCAEVLLALVIMPTLGWKWLLGISSIPTLVYFIMCYWVPESVRYQAVSGKSEKAMETLQKISKVNKKPMPQGQLIVEDMKRGRFQDLVRPDMRRTTILLWVMWIVCGFCYSGVVFLSTQIFEQNAAQEILPKNGDKTQLVGSSLTSGSSLSGNGNAIMDKHGFVDGVCSATGKPCQVFTTEDYLGLLWITLAEFPGILITIFVLDKIGRIKAMGIEFLLYAVAILVFLFKIEGRVLTTVILFLARGLAAAIFISIYVYTPEVYPTSMRSVGIGTCFCMSRIGTMLAPYVAQIVAPTSLPLAVTCYGVPALIAAVLSMLLPFETKGKAMPD